MSTPGRFAWCLVLLVGAGAAAASPARAGTWEALNYGGSNTMSVFKPTSPAASPPILVSLHFCGGSMANAQGWFQSLADKYGFLIIAGKSKGGCWDAALGRSGERAIIVQAVDYVIKNYNADKTRVFAAGASSGACMTQTLLASYPEVFAAGASLAGVPAGAWTGGGEYGWSAPASTTAAQWGDKVRQANPAFTGPRPRLQLWQGMGDTILTYASAYPAQLAQWTNVFGVTAAMATMTSIKPPGAQDTWARTSYKDSAGTVVLEANSGPSTVPHDLTPRGLWTDVVRFFGLDGSAPVVDGGAMGSGGAGGSGSGSGGRGASADGGAAEDAMPAGGRGVGSTGGAPGSGGSSASGGAGQSGGAMGSGGGASGTGGGVGSGGTIAPGTGGAPSAGGWGSGSGAGGGAGAAVGGGGSGGCAVAGRHGAVNGTATSFLLLAAALGLRRRRPRRRKR